MVNRSLAVSALGAVHVARRLVLTSAAVLGTLVLALSPAQAQPVPTAALDRVAEKVAAQGHLRVIVQVDVPSAPEGRMSRLEATRQRSAIRAAQNAAVTDLLGGTGAKVHALFDNVPHLAAEVDANTFAKLRASARVRSIEEDVASPPTLLQSTTLINAPVAWNSGRTGTGWAVAVLDTGVDKTHPFLAGKVVSEACYSSNSTDSTSVCPGGVTASTAVGSGVNCNVSVAGCTHGTHVAGIVAGSGAPDGSSGVAPGAGIIAMQVFSRFPASNSAMSYSSDQIKALERVFALRGTFQIASVNMSLGAGQYTSTCDATNSALKASIDNLRSVGIATVIASGNSSYKNAISAPACISSAVSVGATCDAGPDGSACATGVDGVASYSNIASFVSLLAPGSYITSSVPGNGYAAWNGTSMAAPHVAGAWALLKQANPAMSVDDALSLLRGQAVAVNDQRSGGVVSGMARINLAVLAGSAHSLSVTRSGTGGGSVSSSPSGIQCGSDCGEPYAEGTTVTLTPTTATGSTFTGWTGDCSGTGACTITMSQARNVTATFTAIPYTLSVTKTGVGSGVVSAAAAGIDCGSTCSKVVNAGTSVTLSAVAATGSKFAGWSGACTGTALSCTVAMSQSRSVTANFALLSFGLTVAKDGSGLGSVTSSPSGISCGTTCTVTRTFGTVMSLNPVPAAGSAFGGWGGACTGTGACSVTLSEARRVTATFVRTHNTLTVARAGTGAGSVASSPAGISCGTTCSAPIAVATTITLTPTAAAGSRFAGWTGACSGTGACELPMSAARNVTATFTRNTYALEVTRSGGGGGSVTSAPAGINCGSTCRFVFNSLTVVKLTAKPVAGSVFAGWTGACSGTASTCTVTMNDAASVGATFTLTHHTLSVTRNGTSTGSVTSTLAGINCGTTCSKLMPVDSLLTLVPTPVAESAFTGWTGACTGTDPCTVTMSQPRVVAATFTRTHYTLTVARVGTGSVLSDPAGIDCGTTCKSSQPINSTVTLTAVPADGMRLSGWSGSGCSGTGTCTVTMSAARSVTATFVRITYPLEITRTGSGAVVSSPSAISCGSTCTKPFNSGTTVTLTATPASGWTFSGWSGACSGAARTCSVSMSQARAVGATFAGP